jgi:hypothetical protein
MFSIHKRSLFAGGAFLLLFAVACHNFYKAKPGRTGPFASATVDSLRQLNRHFILRSGSQTFYLTNLALSADQKTLSARLDSVPPEHRHHLYTGVEGNRRYKPGNPKQKAVLSEVHLYTAGLSNLVAGENISLALDGVQKIEVIEKDNKRTTNSYVLGAIGYTLAAFTVAMVIVALTKSSCPFVSAYNGNEFLLQGEIYGGAIYPQLARHDYLPLKMAPLADGTLQLKISNELKEKQYTDMADLWVVTHKKEITVYADESGRLYSVAAPQAPVSAILNEKKDLLPALQHKEDNAMAYLDDTTTTDATNNVWLKFQKPAKAQQAKLVLTIKNSYFLDLLYGELAKGFGSYYEKYLKKQSKKPAAQLQQWITDQQFPLTVCVRTKAGWKKISNVSTIGPLAYRTIVVPVNTGDIEGSEVELRLSSGFMFWEMDYAALDFSSDDQFSVEKLSPVSATDESGKDVLPLLQKEDNRSLEQPQIGNVATIIYKPSLDKSSAKTQTYFLHTRGWYQHVRNYTHGPNVAFLKRFLKPGAFPSYGKELYRKIQAENLPLMAAN